ncbi:MAG: HAD family phosphatase [Sedimentisphaerales bacterium]|nr:HAD family phosphatase [Sedimentisphaerales bacterium]
MLRTVILDFDGVITDSEILHLRAFNKSLVPYGVEISTKDYYTNYLGFSDFDCYKALIDNGPLKINERQISDIIKVKSKIFEKLTKTEGRTIEGVREFLQMLEDNNIPMVICSGSLLVEIELMLEESGLRHFFTEIISAEQVRKGKPHPEGFLLALKKLNEKCPLPIIANECIVIEDSHWGLQAGKAAGMHTIAVTNSYDAEQLGLAEKIVSRLNELTINDLQQLCA